jgi:hypothetical protein
MIDYLSYSSINLYLTCGEAWRRKYLLKEPQPSSIQLMFGSAFHGTVEEYISTRGQEEATYSPEQLFPYKWRACVERDGYNVEWGADTPEQHENEGIRILSTPEVQKLIDSITPLVDEQGVFIERKIELRVPGVPIPVIGYIDLMTADGVPGDFKTSATKWTQDKAEAEIQPLFYLAALHQAGRTVPGLKFRHYVVTKTKQPAAQVLEHSHTWQEVFWLYDLIKRAWDGISREVFPVQPGAWLCSSKFCSAWSQCRGRR